MLYLYFWGKMALTFLIFVVVIDSHPRWTKYKVNDTAEQYQTNIIFMMQNGFNFFLSVAVVWLSLFLFVEYKPTLDLEQTWADYKKQFNKTYEVPEDRQHLGWFKNSLKIVKAHNKRYDLGLETYTMGINQFSDMDDLTFKSYALSGCSFHEKLTVNLFGDSITSEVAPPDSIDWRDQDAVTPVKDQGKIASCWAFSAIGALESAMKIHKGKKTISLSAQQLVDCESYNDVTKGGNIKKAYDYIKECGGLQSENDYPYTAIKGNCTFDESKVVVKISGADYPTEFNEDGLKKACGIHGPIAVGIKVNTNFGRYKAGVFADDNCNGNANHAVLVVGYGNYGTYDYWIIKNSYGTTWGESGYMKLARNRENMCSIASRSIYPVVSWVN